MDGKNKKALGREDRSGRLLEHRTGVAASQSGKFVDLVERMLVLARMEAASKKNKNFSIWTLAAIPLLFSALRCLSIEYERFFHKPREEIKNIMKMLTGNGPDLVQLMDEVYFIENPLRQDILDLYEIRNEIIHSSTTPTGTKDNWPDYLRRIKEKGLLETTGEKNSDYDMLSQCCSLRLLEWACRISTEFAYQIAAIRKPLCDDMEHCFWLAKNFDCLIDGKS